MDTPKFLSMLQTNSLYFARADCLGDPFEGSSPLPNVEFFKGLKANRQKPGFEGFAMMTEEEIDNMTSVIAQARRSSTKETYVNCWHLNEVESAAMWSLYGKSNESICITTKFSTLANALPLSSHLGMITYINYSDSLVKADNLLNFLMTKRTSFAHEREVRALVWTPAANFKSQDILKVRDEGVTVPIDLNAVIDDILVSPASPQWFRALVENVAAKYGVARAVKRSSLSEEPVY